MGALLGGYAGIELAKHAGGFRKATGDRWPAPAAELAFNLLMVSILYPMRRLRFLRGQLFHVYLIAYGSFRFFHEFAVRARDRQIIRRTFRLSARLARARGFRSLSGDSFSAAGADRFD